MPRRLLPLLLAWLIVGAGTALSAHATFWHRITTFAGTGILGYSPAQTDGRSLVVWQPTDQVVQFADVATGSVRQLPIPRSGCLLGSAHRGVAAFDCSPPQEAYDAPLRPVILLLNLQTGHSTVLQPNLGGRTGADGTQSAAVAVGRFWVQGMLTSQDLHPSERRFYVEISTGRVVWGPVLSLWLEPDPDDRVRDLDTTGLRLLSCGPSSGEAKASSAPYFVRLAEELSPFLWIDRCRGGKLVSEVRFRRSIGFYPDGGYGPNPVVMDGAIVGVGAYRDRRVAAYRTSDGAPLGSWNVPASESARVMVVDHRLVVPTGSGPNQAIYVSRDLSTGGPPHRPTRLGVRPGHGIGAIVLGMARDLGEDGIVDDDVAAFLGPGQQDHGDWRYRSGVAQLTAHYRTATTYSGVTTTAATRVSTTWPGTTIYNHPIRLGLRRLARLLPRWRHPACHGRLLAHGKNPTTVLTRTATGQVRATVQASPPPRCAHR